MWWLGCVLATLLQLSSSMNPIIIGGNMFFDSVTHERFYVKGLTYGYEVEDTYRHFWEPAFDNMAALSGVNTIRVYNINPTVDVGGPMEVVTSYDAFMQYTMAHNLYVMVAITPSGMWPWNPCTLNRDGTPELGPGTCYPSCLLSYAQSVVNVFAKYPNVLAFYAGNEVFDKQSTWKAAPCVKAFVRDVKAYIRSCPSFRRIPLAYAAADNGMAGTIADVNNRIKAQYLTCGPEEERVDIFGLNIYRWCTNECTLETCGYKPMKDQLNDLAVPLILSEFGCPNFYYDPRGANYIGQRDWGQIRALYGPQMTDSWSGGTAYAYGVTGGPGFALYVGGTTDYRASPGYQKACGLPNNVCNVDTFAAVLGSVTPANTVPVCAGGQCLPPNFNRQVPQCPIAELTNLGVETTTPATRQGADGYLPIPCPPSPPTAPTAAVPTALPTSLAPTTSMPSPPALIPSLAPSSPPSSPTSPSPSAPSSLPSSSPSQPPTSAGPTFPSSPSSPTPSSSPSSSPTSPTRPTQPTPRSPSHHTQPPSPTVPCADCTGGGAGSQKQGADVASVLAVVFGSIIVIMCVAGGFFFWRYRQHSKQTRYQRQIN